MFDDAEWAPGHGSATELRALVGLLSGLSTETDDAELIDRIGVLERVKAAAAAAQARMTAAFAASQRAANLAAGVPSKRCERGISSQVGLARHESPARAARYTGWATILVRELPHTFTALAAGETTEWRAMLVARETIWLSLADRATVDTELAGRLSTLGDNQVEAETRKIAYRLDPEGFVARSRAATTGRCVSLRPAPDVMTRLTAFVPAPEGVAAYAALVRAADAARAAGDPRSRGQIMADTLIQRVTGQTAAAEVPVTINLVMTDRTLFGNDAHAAPEVHRPAAGNGDGARSSEGGPSADRGSSRDGASGFNEPAHLIGYGPIPAGIARDLARAKGARAWLRRLFANPRTGDLAAMESRARIFPERIRDAIIIRDQICRTPWCGAPIRHADHARSGARGGDTSLANGQGLCEACNYAKQSPGWETSAGTQGTGDSVTTTTPTGHSYVSRPPGLPGSPRHEPSAALDLVPPLTIASPRFGATQSHAA